MKTYKLPTLSRWVTLLLAFFVIACTETEIEWKPSKPDKITPSWEMLSSFNEMYPDAEDAVWSHQMEHYVVNFTIGPIPVNAWFTTDGEWLLSKADISFYTLPEVILQSFKSSKYTDFEVFKAWRMRRKDMDRIYTLELKDEKQDIDVFYSKAGDLIRTRQHVVSTDEFLIHIPDVLMEEIRGLLGHFEILDYWEDALGKLVCVTDEDTLKTVTLDENYHWTSMIWNIEKEDIPEKIIRKFINSDYGLYPIEQYKILIDRNSTNYLFYCDDSKRTQIIMFPESGVPAFFVLTFPNT
jgi:hypothetical protein